MAYVAKGKQGVEEATEVKIHKIRITLTSRNVKNLEKGTSYLTKYVLI
jgi:small subunit ribosomal protein S20e